jgi:hypothetical protein
VYEIGYVTQLSLRRLGQQASMKLTHDPNTQSTKAKLLHDMLLSRLSLL